MSPDIQSFDLDKDPAVLALEKFSTDGQTIISAEISPVVAQQQAAFAKQLEKIKNGTLTYLDSIFKLAVPAAQAGENTTDEDLKIKDKYEQKVEDARKEFERAKKKAKKSRKKAKDYLRGFYAEGYTREEIIDEHIKAGLSERGIKALYSVLDEIAEEDQKK